MSQETFYMKTKILIALCYVYSMTKATLVKNCRAIP